MSRENLGEQIGGADELSFIHRMLKNLKTSKEKRDINVLLLGEIGVGKSTFINAFFNYVNYSSLSKAKNEKLHVPIPTEFTVIDEKYQARLVKVGDHHHHNDTIKVGVSTTQACRSYVYPVPGTGLKIRLIDTPGVGDVRGTDHDNINFENVLSFVQELKHLNAICIFLKMKDSNLTVMFEFCIKHLLSRLEKSAGQNVLFIFTNTRSTSYRPGETLPWLKQMLSTTEIPCEKLNSFCVDNECFRYLAALKNNIQFSLADIDNYTQSWKHSYEECLWMIMYIIGNDAIAGLPPHEVKNTISINEARRLIFQLLQPLADVVQLIQDNVRAVGAHQELLKNYKTDLFELQSNFYIPTIDLTVVKLNQPVTVCTSVKCSTYCQASDKRKWRHRKQCHNPCYLRNVPKEIIDSPELVTCAAINDKGMCVKCSCRRQVHMHVYYEIETFTNKLEDDESTGTIATNRFTLKCANRISNLNKERKAIVKTAAKFACFLKMTAISAYKDTYESYLQYLIDRETSLKDGCDLELLKEMKSMLGEYLKEKIAVFNAMNQSQISSTARDIINSIQALYSLKIFGPKIKELFEAQNRARKDENKSIVKEFVFKIADRVSEMKTGQSPLNEPQTNKQNVQSRPGSSFCQPTPPIHIYPTNYFPPRTMHPVDIHRMNYPNHRPNYSQFPRTPCVAPVFPPPDYFSVMHRQQIPQSKEKTELNNYRPPNFNRLPWTPCVAPVLRPPDYFSAAHTQQKPQNIKKTEGNNNRPPPRVAAVFSPLDYSKTEPNNILPQVCDEGRPEAKGRSKVNVKSHNLYATSSTSESEDE